MVHYLLHLKGTILTCEFKAPADLPACCDGCGALHIQRHNEVRDWLVDISSEVWLSVTKEPIIFVREADPSSNDVGLRLDLGV